MSRSLRIVHRPVMVLQGHSHCLGHCVQGVLGLARQQNPGNPHRIHIGEPIRKALSPAIFHDKTHVKAGIVGHQHTAFAEFQETGQHLLDHGSLHDHGIVDARQLLNLKGNGYIRVHKAGKPLRDLPSLHLHRADLYDPVVHRGKTRGLDIEHHKVRIQVLPLIAGDNLF